MSHTQQLALLVEELKHMKPSGAMRLARLMGAPRQTVYQWKHITCERSARRILLDIKHVSLGEAEDIRGAIQAALAPLND